MARQKVVNGIYYDLTAAEEAEIEARADAADLDLTRVRGQRNGYLAGCDWTQLADVALIADEVAAWATYRQELRDYPAQSDRVSTLPEWPTPPE